MRWQKRNRERVNVYLDGDYAFPLPALVAATLRIGQALTDAEIAELQGRDAVQRAYERALRFLGSRPRSVTEVRRLFDQNELPADALDAVIGRLLAAGYLDDAAFARYWVSNREQFRPKSPLALRQELRQKGVGDAEIAEALATLNSEDSVYRAGQAQARRLQHADQPTFRQKLVGHLLRRGFSHEQVWPVVNRLWAETHPEHEYEDDMTDQDMVMDE